MEYKFSEEEMVKLKDAFRCLVSLAVAESKDNYATCGCYHIQPFNTSWDEKTVDEVKYHVSLYLNTWVIPTFSKLLQLSEHDVILKMLADWHETQARGIHYKLKNKL